MKSKDLWTYSIIAFVISIVGCSFYFYKQKKSYSRLEESTSKLILQEKDNLAKLVSAYKQKYFWINSFIQNKKQPITRSFQQAAEESLNQLNKLQIKSQSDLENFEKWNNNLNQLIVKEVIKFNSNQKSVFYHISQIRELERYDRNIDFARTQYSTWSYQYYQAKSEMEKNLFSKSNDLTDVPFYEIDHLIFKKNKISNL